MLFNVKKKNMVPVKKLSYEEKFLFEIARKITMFRWTHSDDQSEVNETGEVERKSDGSNGS